MKNLNDLRSILFGQIESLKNDSNPEAIARAKAINDLSQTIVGTAKIEIEFARATDAKIDGRFIYGSSTIEHQPEPEPQTKQSTGFGAIPEKTGRKM